MGSALTGLQAGFSLTDGLQDDGDWEGTGSAHWGGGGLDNRHHPDWGRGDGAARPWHPPPPPSAWDQVGAGDIRA
jgi:hypothetical protein